MDLTAHLGFGSSRFNEAGIEAGLGSGSAKSFTPTGASSASGVIAGLGLRTTITAYFKAAAEVELKGAYLGYQLSMEYTF